MTDLIMAITPYVAIKGRVRDQEEAVTEKTISALNNSTQWPAQVIMYFMLLARLQQPSDLWMKFFLCVRSHSEKSHREHEFH